MFNDNKYFVSKELRALCRRFSSTAERESQFLYRDILREALGLSQTLELCSLAIKGTQEPKALKILTTVYHSSHSLNERKGIISQIIHKTSKLTVYVSIISKND